MKEEENNDRKSVIIITVGGPLVKKLSGSQNRKYLD